MAPTASAADRWPTPPGKRVGCGSVMAATALPTLTGLAARVALPTTETAAPAETGSAVVLVVPAVMPTTA
ncbi:hypothetical protein [Mycobacterium paraterrae]|uniref:Uncharacterized protein n=1 Tax=Mycobacterium paraterrae TaxID=577492 RepID=A0ABY3VK37_9MYCO|nr:hypothetical protein [Mycobacterium paraterrae]UMB69011.1 hypothetical protein MKK62_21950 [Mycobacterium paraterrae]